MEIVREETPQPSTKYSRYNLMAGLDTQDDNLTVSALGQVFLPFGGRHAFQAQGDFMYSFQQDEGQLDFGIVSRFGPLQTGVFSSFKYVRFGEFSHAGGLGQTTISGVGIVSTAGSVTVTPDRTTTYTLTASNAVGEASATSKVVVSFFPF